MNLFFPSEYFDLSTFEHASIFDEGEAVWIALKKIDSYITSQSLGNILGHVHEGAYLVNPEKIFLGKGTVVEPGAFIQGPCIIGENCQVRHGAYIRGNVITGNRCVIGHASEVKNSIFFHNAHAGHFAYVGDSILGNHVNLGAGVKCANLRFDNHHVPIIWNGRRIDSGLRKFGAIFGDHAQAGCNSVTNPGTLVGKKSHLGPCTSVRGVIPKNAIVKAPETVMITTQN